MLVEHPNGNCLKYKTSINFYSYLEEFNLEKVKTGKMLKFPRIRKGKVSPIYA